MSVMAGAQDDDMYLFQGGLDQTAGGFAGQDFDNFLAASPGNNDGMMMTDGYMNPNDLTIKREHTDPGPTSKKASRSSRSSASSSSSSTSTYMKGNISVATSTASPEKHRNNQGWGSGINGLSMPAGEQYYDDTSMSGLDQDFEASNQQMASAFDFDTAASTPSGFDAMSMAVMRPNPVIQPYRRVATMGSFPVARTTASRIAGTQGQFFLGSREASPLNAMFPTTAATSPWTKNSPSSGLEETFNHITMSGDSPGNGTLSPTMQYNSNGFSFDADFGATPQSFQKDMTSPPSTIHSGDGNTTLTIHPTSLKSRVETQIPIKMVLHPLPHGAKKLRLPTHTVSKPKFLAKPEIERSPEILELYTSLVCTSAMQESARLERALARARGEDLSSFTRPSPAPSSGSHSSSRDDDDKPLNGGEVKICSGCIQRERKRASRKKQKKPEEEEMFQKDEEKRVVVFNTSEVKDWVEVTKESQPGAENVPPAAPGAMQVELPMRIACYCRHQNEKMGFQVIFTIKDFRDKVIAQAMTNSIMITDDHKTHNAPAAMQNTQMSQISTAPQLPGAGVFSTAGMDMPTPQLGAKFFKQSFSTTDLHGLQHNFNPNFPMAPTTNPFVTPGSMSAMSSGTMTPRILSRPASPSGPTGPTTKRRKQSGSGKLPTALTMTRLDTSHNAPLGSATMPNTTASSPYANMASFMSSGDRSFQMHPRQQPFSTSPPTPNGNDGAFPASINRSFSLENMPRQALISAPASRQPSRPSSPRPHSNRNSFGATDSAFGQAVSNGLMGHASRRPPPTIHKLVPAEGSVTGGTEVTLLGNGFYQGLEVMFGDTEATTTTFWGEKCLNCIAPPALQPGVVAVVFKHDHPQYSATPQSSQTRPSIFTYIDDREIEVLRLALRTLGKTLNNPTDDPYSAAQQLLQQSPHHAMWPQQGGYALGGGHQRQMYNLGVAEIQQLESDVLDLMSIVKRRQGYQNLYNIRSQSGLTLLHFASSLGMKKLVLTLLSAGANPNLVDKLGHTPMHHAAMHGFDRIIDALRLAGADHRVKSVGSFTPADLATTLRSHQATLRPFNHTRARSAGTSSGHTLVFEACSNPSQSSWDHESLSYDSNYDMSSNESIESTPSTPLRMPFAQPNAISVAPSRAISRRGSNQYNLNSYSHTNAQPYEGSEPPSALVQAWRQLLTLTQTQQQQLADHIQQFQDRIQQDRPLVRRMSSLFQQRKDVEDANQGFGEAREPSLSSAPPAYNDLFPDNSNLDGDLAIKKGSLIQAAADAAVDMHYRNLDSVSSEGKLDSLQSQTAGKSFVQHVTSSVNRRSLFFWMPLLAIILALVLTHSSITQVFSVVMNRIGKIAKRDVVEVM